ncbi:hypothetical protein ACFOY2_41075 [Nonomuraea purpurea]|uniref:Uncharacterized protein n=1 Tax=Nonomuraea purpurea TaxID=1849276 RepID=A0ABV8GKY9_9ACTN
MPALLRASAWCSDTDSARAEPTAQLGLTTSDYRPEPTCDV